MATFTRCKPWCAPKNSNTQTKRPPCNDSAMRPICLAGPLCTAREPGTARDCRFFLGASGSGRDNVGRGGSLDAVGPTNSVAPSMCAGTHGGCPHLVTGRGRGQSRRFVRLDADSYRRTTRPCGNSKTAAGTRSEAGHLFGGGTGRSAVGRRLRHQRSRCRQCTNGPGSVEQ